MLMSNLDIGQMFATALCFSQYACNRRCFWLPKTLGPRFGTQILESLQFLQKVKKWSKNCQKNLGAEPLIIISLSNWFYPNELKMLLTEDKLNFHLQKILNYKSK